MDTQFKREWEFGRSSKQSRKEAANGLRKSRAQLLEMAQDGTIYWHNDDSEDGETQSLEVLIGFLTGLADGTEHGVGETFEPIHRHIILGTNDEEVARKHGFGLVTGLYQEYWWHDDFFYVTSGGPKNAYEGILDTAARFKEMKEAGVEIDVEEDCVSFTTTDSELAKKYGLEEFIDDQWQDHYDDDKDDHTCNDCRAKLEAQQAASE